MSAGKRKASEPVTDARAAKKSRVEPDASSAGSQRIQPAPAEPHDPPPAEESSDGPSILSNESDAQNTSARRGRAEPDASGAGSQRTQPASAEPNGPPPAEESPVDPSLLSNESNEQTTSVESEKKRGKRRAVDEDPEDSSSRKQSKSTGKPWTLPVGSDGAKAKIRKLAPARPFPTVPTSVSATGPRSAHVEGKNYICVTRKTPLGAYLRRCKDVVLKDGHKTLHLYALGAAIPHMLQLSISLPEILPYPREEIHTAVRTGTVEVQDEVIPDDQDEDIEYRTRGKSSLSIVITIGDGVDEGAHTGKGKRKPGGGGNGGGKRRRERGRKGGVQPGAEQVVVREEDMEE